MEKTIRVQVTNVENPSEVDMFETTTEDFKNLVRILKTGANYADEIAFSTGDGEYIVITQNSEEGYNADAYASYEAYKNDEDVIGGGLCTGTLGDAINMALTER